MRCKNLLDTHQVSHHKSDGSKFLKISSEGLGLDGLKVPKVSFLGFRQKSYPFRYGFLVQHVVPMFLEKQHVCKCLVLDLQSKNLKTNQIRMQDSLNHKISKNLRQEVEFLDIQERKWTWEVSFLHVVRNQQK